MDSKNSLTKANSSENKLSLKKSLGQKSDEWMAKNRSLVLRQTPQWANSLVLFLISIGGIAVVAGIFFRIDEVVTVSGQLKTIGGTHEVETPAGGRIDKLSFQDGELVEKGDLLVSFDTREAVEQKTTLLETIDLQKKQYQSQLATLDSQIVSINNKLSVVEKRLVTKEKLVSEMANLVQQGGFQKMQFLEQLDQVYEIKKQLNEFKEQKSRINLEKDQLKLDHLQALAQLKTSLNSVDLQLQYRNVLAPVSGIVFDPQVSLRSVLQPGERILSIVPQNGLYGEVYISNADIGYIKDNQNAKVRIDAFPFARYGEIESKVISISADALAPDQEFPFYRFPVKLKLDKDYLVKDNFRIPLKPGMSITSNLKLRDKRVISLLSDILVDQTDSIKGIRQQ